jgi:hypothetical protein
MSNDTIISLARQTVITYSRQNGGPGRREGFRVEWHLMSRRVDFRTTRTFVDSSMGLCNAWETKGAAERDDAIFTARHQAEVAALALMDSQEGLAGMVRDAR